MVFEGLLLKYEKIKSITKQMLIMIKQDDWDNLFSLQTEYELAIEFLNELQIEDITAKMSAEEQTLIKSQVTEILLNQKQLQEIVDSEQTEIAELISKEIVSKIQINSYNDMSKLS